MDRLRATGKKYLIVFVGNSCPNCNVFCVCTSSVVPRVVVRSPSVHEEGGVPPQSLSLGLGLPVTILQIWLADGRRLVKRFNLSHTLILHCYNPSYTVNCIGTYCTGMCLSQSALSKQFILTSMILISPVH